MPAAAFILVLGAACGKKTEQQTSIESGITDAVSGVSVTVSTAWEDDASNFEVHGSCSESGSKTSPGSSDCVIAIGEEKLNLSKLKFEVTRSGTCAVINFRPYYYRTSINAAYTPPNQTTPVNCSAPGSDDDPIECWGGVAKELVTSFPRFRGLFTTSDSLEAIASSSNEKSEYGNRYTSNDMPTIDRETDIAPDPDAVIYEGYVGVTTPAGGSMVDYSVNCIDQWSNVLASITIYILDFDGTNPSADEVPSWDNP